MLMWGRIRPGMNKPTYVAIDGASNIWLINSASPYSVSELSNAAAAISGSSGYQSGNLNAPGAIAVDISGDVWVTNKGGSTVTEMIGAGYPVAPLYTLKPGVEP